LIGKTWTAQRDFLNDISDPIYGKPTKTANTYNGAAGIKVTDGDKPNHFFWMLEYESESTKYLSYPCNAEEGTDIIAMAYIK